ncbi:hypothetical protein LTR05_004920 [Lithohypha guttulata]|uniref:Copper homeostasis protein cutC homolog n=1 Tax=Lithohypha guttulata TaxID=1690604 RepID=A0AAN7T0B6_9EURO|nr:hypothetical protein LTR05_004920 [Lithohypha guttulata]
MLQEIRICKELGVPGVTLGVLKQGCRVDVERTRALVEAAKPMDVTFSRAFDEVHDLTQALDDVITSGCTRLLTSGGARNVELGKEMLTNLVAVANSRIAIMPGGGVRHQNIVGIVKATGVNMVHSSAMDHGLNVRRESEEATGNMRIFRDSFSRLNIDDAPKQLFYKQE